MKLIRFLVMKKLGLSPFLNFKFNNQKSDNNYYFDKRYNVMKLTHTGKIYESSVSFNYLTSITRKDITVQTWKGFNNNG